jgi:hypothetical protein
MPKSSRAPTSLCDESERLAIPLTPVKSNQVAAVGYDASTKTLAATFVRGAGEVYQYPNVEPSMHEALMKADSIGAFFGQHIKPLAFKKFGGPGAT